MTIKGRYFEPSDAVMAVLLVALIFVATSPWPGGWLFRGAISAWLVWCDLASPEAVEAFVFNFHWGPQS